MRLGKNIDFTKLELQTIKRLCAKHGLEFDVKFMRNENLTWKGAVACFSVLTPNTVYLCKDQPNVCKLLPYIAHELKHREQYKRMGKIRYLILANPLWRQWTIEPEAYNEEDRINLEVIHG